MSWGFVENPGPSKGSLDGAPLGELRRVRVARLVRVAIALAIGAALLSTHLGAQVLKRPHDDTQTPDQNQSKLNAKKPKNYPRAIAVVEFLPGGSARLVPVALWINDRFYDASLYGANPAPMAVQPETVYEATNNGESLGLFTVTTPEELKGSWIALGNWRPHQALDEKLAAQAAKQPKPKATDDLDSDSGRPVLHRSGSSGSSSGGSSSSGSSGTGNSSASAPSASPSTASSGTSPAQENDPNRPTLKKPGETTDSAPSATSSSSAPAEDTDPNRPTLKKPSESTNDDSSAATGGTSSSTQVANAGKSSAGAASPDENDPSRPVLRRGKPEPTMAAASSASAPASVAGPNLASPAPAVQGKPDPLTGIVRTSFPAVSDAGRHEMRSLLYAMSPQERASKSDQMSTLALDEIRKFIAARHTPPLPKNAAITDYNLRAYDLEFSNSPTLVITAKLAVPGAKPYRGGEFDYFVTLVAREDFNGNPIKIFTSVTDSNHLDAFPRMEIVDAVDADANGRGDLLFRQYSDTGINYSLYRVFPYEMQKVFEGGSGA